MKRVHNTSFIVGSVANAYLLKNPPFAVGLAYEEPTSQAVGGKLVTSIRFWWEDTDGADAKNYVITAVTTGTDLPEEALWIGTVQTPTGAVWHVFILNGDEV